MTDNLKRYVDGRHTFAYVERAHLDGLLTREEWEEYCYLWRESVFRFSMLGEEEANRHKERLGL